MPPNRAHAVPAGPPDTPFLPEPAPATALAPLHAAPLLDLELALPPTGLQALARFLSPLRAGTRPRRATHRVVLLDSADGALLARNRIAAASRTHRWIEALEPPPDHPPGLALKPLAEAPLAEQLDGFPSAPIALATIEGTLRRLDLPGGLALTIADLRLQALTARAAACRLRLQGPALALIPLARTLAARLPVTLPTASLAAEAVALSGRTLPGADRGPALATLDDALAAASATAARTLAREAARAGQADPATPVHRMRVALRRLRSALDWAGPELDPLRHTLRHLAARLAQARDWDVFLAGPAADVAQAFPGDARLRRLLDAAARRRDAAQDELRAYLASADFRALAIDLSLLAATRPWPPIATTASATTRRALHRLRKAGHDFDALAPDDLHRLRKRAKELRYTLDLATPLLDTAPATRLPKRLAALQDALGAVNDAAEAPRLAASLATNPATRVAAGIVEGFLAARLPERRQAAAEAWRRVRKA